MELKHADVTGKILRAYYHVYNQLGAGFLEKVYENAFVAAAGQLGLDICRQKDIRIYFEGVEVGEYKADVVVNDLVLVELKACSALREEHDAQLLNYLKATRYEIGMLLNFGPKPETRRRVFDNSRKGNLSWVAAGKIN